MRTTNAERHPALHKISKRYGISLQELNLEFRKRAQLMYNLYEKKIFKFDQVQDIINEYYNLFKYL